MAEQKTVNLYILVCVLKGAMTPTKVAEGLTWAKLKELAKNDADKYDSMRAIESWKDKNGVMHYKAWDVSLNDKGEIEYSTSYSFTDDALSAASAALADIAAI